MTPFIAGRRFGKPIFGEIFVADDIGRNRPAKTGFEKIQRIPHKTSSGIGIDYHAGERVHSGRKFHRVDQAGLCLLK